MQPFLEGLEFPPAYSSPEEAVKSVEFQAVAATIRLPGAPLGFHGALLQRGQVGLALVGMKEAGKSTLAAALTQAGWSLFSDDAFQLEEGEMKAYPVCRRARLRAETRELLSETFWTELQGRRGSFSQPDGGLVYHSPSAAPNGVPLTHLVLLQPEPGGLKELEESEVMLRSVVHSHTYFAEGLPQSLAKLAPVSNRLRGFELGRQPLVDQVEVLGSLK